MKAMAWTKIITGNDAPAASGGIYWRSKQRWTTALFTCSVLGVCSGAFELIISGLNLLGFLERHQGVGRLGTLLVALAFPLLMLMAHAMDKIDAIEKKDKREKLEAKQKQAGYSPEQWRIDDDKQL